MSSPRKWIAPGLRENPTAGEAFFAVTRAALEQIQSNVGGAAAGLDPEYLHQLRVGVRRLRSALLAFRKLLRRDAAAAEEARWAAIMRTLGAARDWDVFCAALEDATLRAAAEQRRTSARQKVRKLLRASDFDLARRRSFEWSQGGPWRRSARPAAPLRKFAAHALHRLHRKLVREAQGIDWRDAARRHRVRIKVKRLRYACDFFAAAFGSRRARAYLESLRGLQDILGEMNDIEVQRGLLRRLVPRGSPFAVVRAEAQVRAKLAARERGLVSALEPAWTSFEARSPFWKPA